MIDIQDLDLRAADCLRAFPSDSFDASLSDPPYGLGPDGKARDWDMLAALRTGGKRRGFMGRAWDAGVPGPTFWREMLRVLKPGAPVLAFGGTRTFHRLTCAMEDAGFEIADCIGWWFAQGMPKSFNVSKGIDAKAGAVREVVCDGAYASRRPRAVRETNIQAAEYGFGAGHSLTAPATPEAALWHGYGTGLAPSWEPCVLAWKPFDGTIVANALEHGVGGLNIDGCRLPRSGHSAKPDAEKIAAPPGIGINLHPSGGWPPNVCLDDVVAAELDAWIGERTSGRSNGFVGDMQDSVAMGRKRNILRPDSCFGDSGGPSRYFFCAKVSRWEREFGCDHLPLRSPGATVGREEGTTGIESGRAGAGRTGEGVRNHHPTLKPISLTTWLARLILPPAARRHGPRRILVPFSGSGSEMIGAWRAGWDEIVGVENDPDYRAIAEARIRRWQQVPREMSIEDARAADNGRDDEDERQVSLFGETGT